MAYATRRDLYRYGLPRGALAMPGRVVESSLASSDTLTLDGHGLETGEAVLVRAVDGGTLSAPLAEGTTYYVIRVTDSTFKLAASEGGAAINLTTNGDQMMVAAELPVDDVLELYSRWLDDLLPAHAVPLTEPYPVIVVATVAELAAKKLLDLSGQQSGIIDAAEIAAKAKLERWAKGLPVRDARVTNSATNCAVKSTLSGSTDSRGWGSGSLP
jgi:hypothetical protein